MTQEQFDKALYIKSNIEDLNKLMDSIERQKKVVKDPELKKILAWAHVKVFNELSEWENKFSNI